MSLLLHRVLALVIILISCVGTPLNAQTNVDAAIEFGAPKSKIPPPEVDAQAWALVEFNSGRLVVGKGAEVQYPPASITKLMTNYVIFESLKKGVLSLEDQVPISEHAWRAEGSRMFAEVNSKVSLEALLKSTVIQSGNDAAIALAEHTAGSEQGFAQMMNDVAAELGMAQSNFMNSTGLPAIGHRMTAFDIAKLSAAIIRNHPDFYSWYSEKSFSHNNITQYNRNKLIWKDSSVDGLKTGHTEAAGFCLVGSAEKKGQRWIAVVLGSKDEKAREKAVLDLLNYGFAAYRPVKMLDSQTGLATVDVYYGDADKVLLQAQEVANIVVPSGREGEVEVHLQISPYYEAPIEIGQVMGLATLTLGEKVLADVPLLSINNIKSGGWWSRLVDYFKLMFTGSDQSES